MGEPGREIGKIINTTFIRDMCHARDMKMSEEALRVISQDFYQRMQSLINDSKEHGAKVILRRYAEGRFV